ncbi:MAG: hypothetical protein AAGM33_08810, partial [Pseudomonadota bacterium]
MATIAFMLAVHSQAAQAQATPGPVISPTQAFQANPTFAQGNGVHDTTPNLDTVTLSTTETVINWATLDVQTPQQTNTSVNVLDTGSTLQFVGPSGGYTVLNRILPTAGTGGTFRPVSLNGTVDSRLGTVGGAQGGDIWFYSPGGIITGASSRFDVGSLILSASTLDNIDNGGTQLNFTGVSQTDATVTVSAGTAINTNGYVAIVAPRIEQNGNINADGSIAYVAADEAVLTINQGLFDISVGIGTSNTNGIVHNGVTTGPARSGDADNQTIYMVAVPKNQALTTLIAGSA